MVTAVAIRTEFNSGLNKFQNWLCTPNNFQLVLEETQIGKKGSH